MVFFLVEIVVFFLGIGIVSAFCIWFKLSQLRSYTYVFIAGVALCILYLWLSGLKASDFKSFSPENFTEQILTESEKGGLKAEEVEKIKPSLIEFFKITYMLLPAGLLVFLLLAGILEYHIIRFLMAKAGASLLPHIPFNKWQVFDSFAWFFIISGAITLYGIYMPSSLALTFGANILFLVCIFYLLVGLATAAFYFEKWKIPKSLSLLNYILLLLLFPFQMLLAVLGIFDTWFDWRKLRKTTDEQINTENK